MKLSWWCSKNDAGNLVLVASCKIPAGGEARQVFAFRRPTVAMATLRVAVEVLTHEMSFLYGELPAFEPVGLLAGAK